MVWSKIQNKRSSTCTAITMSVWIQAAKWLYGVHLIIIIIILIKCYSLTRVKLTALYKHLFTKNTLTYISANKNLNYCSFNYYYHLSNNTHTHTQWDAHTSLRLSTHTTINKTWTQWSQTTAPVWICLISAKPWRGLDEYIVRAQEMCKSWSGRLRAFPVPDKPYSFCGRKEEEEEWTNCQLGRPAWLSLPFWS